jgi:hypothetical protein
MNSSDGAPIPDDGIPVLTDVVEVAELPAIAEPGIDAAGEAQTATEVSLSLAMFPELEPGAVVELEREREPFGVDDSLAPNEDAPLPELPEPPAFAGGYAAEFTTAGSQAQSLPGFVESDTPVAASPAPVTFSAAAIAEPESRNEMETRIFEALAARLDRLIDERLEPVIEGSVEAAFAGVKAGLAASLNQAIREAVEQAVRDEFEKRPYGGGY